MKRIICIAMLGTALAACQAGAETAPPAATTVSPTRTIEPAPSELACARLGDMCGGLQGILCCGRLICDYGPDPMYPDKSGVCSEDLRPPEPLATLVSPTCTSVLQQPLTIEGIILTVMEDALVELSVEIRPGDRYHVVLAQDVEISRQGQDVSPEELSPGMLVRIQGLWIPGGRQITAEGIDILQ